MIATYSDNTFFISELIKGEQKAYTYLVDTYHHRLCAYALSLTHDKDAAEDIVQNVFIKIWKRRNQLKPDFSINSYLYKSVYNEFIDSYRKQKAIIPLEKKYLDALNYVVEDDDQTLDQAIKIIKKEIEDLPPKCKEIFLLSKEEGLTNIEIAEYKQVSIKSVEAHITKAFFILRGKIKGRIESIMFFLYKKPKKVNKGL